MFGFGKLRGLSLGKSVLGKLRGFVRLIGLVLLGHYHYNCCEFRHLNLEDVDVILLEGTKGSIWGQGKGYIFGNLAHDSTRCIKGKCKLLFGCLISEIMARGTSIVSL